MMKQPIKEKILTCPASRNFVFIPSFDYKNIKHKLETFADKHFKSALNEFNREISLLKDQIPDDFSKIEELSNEIRTYFNSFLEKKLFDYASDLHLKISAVTLESKLVCFMNS